MEEKECCGNCKYCPNDHPIGKGNNIFYPCTVARSLRDLIDNAVATMFFRLDNSQEQDIYLLYLVKLDFHCILWTSKEK